MKIIIDNIFPYKKNYYRSCFFSSLFPILEHFGHDKIIVMANDTIRYGMIETDYEEFPTVRYHSQYSLNDVLSQFGLRQTELRASEKNDVRKEICDELRNNHPMIMWVDCYDLMHRKDTYHKTHNPHTILLYGIDEENERCYIIDHTEMESPTYIAMTVDYANLYEAYIEFKNLYNEKLNTFPLTAYSQAENFIEKAAYESLPQRYLCNCKKSVAYCDEDEKILIRYIEILQRAVQDQKLMDAAIKNIMLSMNDIVNAKKSEVEKLNYLLGSEPGKMYAEIEKLWNTIRIPFAKYLYSNHFKTDDMKESIDLIAEVMKAERRWKNYILDISVE